MGAMETKITILCGLYYKALQNGYDGQLVMDKYKVVIYDHLKRKIEFISEENIDFWIRNLKY